MWMKLRKIASPRNIVITITSALIFGAVYLISGLQDRNYPIEQNVENRALLPAPECHRSQLEKSHSVNNQFQQKGSNANAQTRIKVLVFLREGRNQLGHDIIMLLESVRFKFHTQSGDIRNLPVLIDSSKGRYALIIFEDYFTYLSLNQWNREMIDKYCLDYDVGIVSFLHSPKHGKSDDSFHQVPGFPLKYSPGVKLKDYELNATAPMLRVARPGKILKGNLWSDWVIFEGEHPTYRAVSYAVEVSSSSDRARRQTRAKKKSKKSRHRRGLFAAFSSSSDDPHVDYANTESDSTDEHERLITVVQDAGHYDGIQRVLFGSGLRFWLHKVLFLDALSYISRGKLIIPLERYIQIDIDDVFVGIEGNRMEADDVVALVSFQNELRKTIPNFTFQLGFSGKFIFKGTESETEGDRLFLKVHDNFAWFPHMWSHMQAHWFNNITELCSYMDINYRFSIRHHLNTSSRYAVAPHHAGVFPVHEQLYECWHRIWNITTTSTEEYPHLRPDHKRRGFIYKGVRTLPRQTCGLFTHTMILDEYPGGPDVLHGIINGGSLFTSFLYNQFNIFMTHLSNYGNDRLGIYTFDRAIKFVECWTNLQLLQVPPSVMAEKYFNLYPDEKEPVWLNPCLDKRHLEIWSENKNCDQLPEFVVVGPQKTGTTALYWFLTMHPNVKSNYPSKTTFEELQFFSGPNYLKGIDWYMDYFPFPVNDTILFEKSATYFDQEVVAKRLNALLPKKQIVVVLVDPAKRAYSWYQHMRSHDDKTALSYTFYETIHARRKGSPPSLISLQRRCLDPGFYADHLEKWLEYLQAQNIVIVDGEMLKEDPARAMQQLQTSLGFKEIFDYEAVLKFDKKKGFFCQLLDTGKTKCLGKSKGRQYPDMDEQSQEFLQKYYSEANKKLVRTLELMNKPIPAWLTENTNL